MRRAVFVALFLAGGFGLARCGSSRVTTVSPQPVPTDQPPIITLRAAGADPIPLHLFNGPEVTFINADSVPHTIYPDPHPAHDSCRGLLKAVELQPGEQVKITGLPFDACFFHDEARPTDRAFQGVVVVH
jgi:hypothetical protein